MIKNRFAIHRIPGFLLLGFLFAASSARAQQPEPLPAALPTGSQNQAVIEAQEVFSLARSRSPEAQARLKQALSDENWYVRGEAARALGQLGDKSVAALLAPLTQDQNWFVRD